MSQKRVSNRKRRFESSENKHEVFIKPLLEVKKDIVSLEEVLKSEMKKLAILEKLAEQKQSMVLEKKGTLGVHKLSQKPFDGSNVSALTDLMQKDLNLTEEMTECILKSNRVEVLETSEDTIIRLTFASGTVHQIHFDLEIVSKFQIMTGEERTAEVRKVQFSPMAPELVPLEKYLLETKCLHILVRALRTFQSLGRAMQAVKMELAKAPLELLAQPNYMVISFSPSLLSPKKRAQPLKLSWKIAFSPSCQNFVNVFDLTVPEGVLMLYSSQPEISALLSKEVQLETAEDVRLLFSIAK